MTEAEFQALVEEHLALGSPPLCPELRTLEGHGLVSLWEAAERAAGSEVEPPFWAYSWPGSQALARFVLDQPSWVRSKSVLDMGCGNGLAALAASMAGASRVLANDIDRAALWMTARNAEENVVTIECDERDRLGSAPPVPPFEVVLAGDVFYARQVAARMEAWLREAAQRGALVLVADPERAYRPREGVREIEQYEVPVPWDIEGVHSRTTSVLRVEG